MGMTHNVPVQSLIDHIKTAIDVDPWAKEMVEELLKEQEAEIKRLKGELHGLGDLFHTLPKKTEKVIAEQPKIVRCKDCIYGKQLFPDYISCEISEENESGCHASHKPDWFCADGVAKDINVLGNEGR